MSEHGPVEEICAIMSSLAAVMQEETQRLEQGARASAIAELAEAKVRLVGSLEEALARAARHEADWARGLAGVARQAYADAVAALRKASAANAAMLERQIELSSDIMDAIAAEARRASGNRAYAYGASGTVARADLTTPISLNSQF